MPRQRKAQSGATRLWTGRVANTTTGSTTTQAVYRIPRWGNGCCLNAGSFEITWTSPVKVHIEWENIYRIYLDNDALETTIERIENLNLTNVTASNITSSAATIDSLTAGGTTTNTLTATTGTVSTLTSTDITSGTVSASDSISTNNLNVSWTATIATLDLTDVNIAGDLTVAGTSAFTGDMTAWNIWAQAVTTVDVTSTWDATLNNLTTSGNATLANATITWQATMSSDLSLAWDATIGWDVAITWTTTMTGDVTASNDLSVGWDLTVTDDLTTNGVAHFNALETTWNADVGGTLRVDGAINGWNWAVITGQVESDTIRTGEIVTDELRVNDGLYLTAWGVAPDFVLQAEKGEPNGVTPLNVNGKVDQQYLPPIYTSAIVKVGTGTFSNSDTSVVVDADITADSFVAISNYQDIIGDLNEVINVGQLTVVSNQTETWSYKYIVVNPLTACD